LLNDSVREKEKREAALRHFRREERKGSASSPRKGPPGFLPRSRSRSGEKNAPQEKGKRGNTRNRQTKIPPRIVRSHRKKRKEKILRLGQRSEKRGKNGHPRKTRRRYPVGKKGAAVPREKKAFRPVLTTNTKEKRGRRHLHHH